MKQKQRDKVYLIFASLMIFTLVLFSIYFATATEKYQEVDYPQQSHYFTAEEYPYGNEGIYTREDELVIIKDGALENLTVAIAAGTGSMLPSIPSKALLILIPIIEEDLRVGDIITINTKDGKIIHRLVNITEDGYKTKGDNNKIQDLELWQIDDLDEKLVGLLW